MSRGHEIPGFDYRKGHAVRMTLNDWRQMMNQVCQAGGKRRAEHGETFIVSNQGEIIAEAYQIIQVQP